MEIETSTADEAVSTPAPSEIVENATDEPQGEMATMPSDDPWADLGSEDKVVEKPEAEKAGGDEEKPAEEAPLEAQAVEEVLEGKDPKEDSDEGMSEKEMLERQRNATARRYAERNAKKAEIVKAYQFEDTPIAEVAQQLKGISEERYTQLSQHAAHQLVDTNPDAAFKRIYAVKMLSKDPGWDPATAEYPSLDDLMGRKLETAAAAPAPPAANLSEMTKDLDQELAWDWRDPQFDDNFIDERERTLAVTLRTMEASLHAEKNEKSELEAKVERLTKAVEGIEAGKQTTAQTELQTDLSKENNTFRSSVAETLLPQLLRKAGLEPSKDDTPKIAAFKQNKAKLFEGNDVRDSAFETFAYEESSVTQLLETVTTRIVESHLKAISAERAGKKDEAVKYRKAAAEEKITILQLLAQAGKEFISRDISPDIELIGELSGKLAAPIKEAAQRVEVTSNGNGSAPARKPAYETADDVWGAMVTDAQKDDQLRSAA